MVRQRPCTAAPRALYARTVKAQAVAASLALRSAESWAKPALTRRRYSKRSDCWHVYYGDVHVGTIALPTGARSASTKGNGMACIRAWSRAEAITDRASLAA